MWLIVGLGNPGSKYAFTRHNIGFLTIDFFAKSLEADHGRLVWSEEHKAHICKTKIDQTPVVLAKPNTFMNRSGESVQALMNYYKINQEHLIVIQDDIDQEYGKARFHKNRGHGGHNGIRDISEKLGSADYVRLKLGVGRPPHPNMEVADYVLSKFSEEEQNTLSEFLNKAGDAIESLLFDGLAKASTKYN